jgi:hypothetical protein
LAVLLAASSLVLAGCPSTTTSAGPSPGSCGDWEPLHLSAIGLDALHTADLTLCSTSDDRTMYVANSADGVVWSVAAPVGVQAQQRVDQDRFMVPLFEQSVGFPGFGVHLLEPGTSYELPTYYGNTRLSISPSPVQVAWTGEKILYKAGIDSASGYAAGSVPEDTPRGRAVKACLTTAFQDGYQLASEPDDQRVASLEALWFQPSTLSCFDQLNTAFRDPTGGLPDVAVDSAALDRGASGLDAFLEDALKIAGDELPHLIH